MYQKASRLKLRFATTRGDITIEDLWDVPLTNATGKVNLNDIAKGLSRKLKELDTEDFVDEKTSEDMITRLAFDIVLDVIKVRKDEATALGNARAIKEQDQKIMALIAQKKDASLGEMSVEQLEALLSKNQTSSQE